jgi:hypothetical protein
MVNGERIESFDFAQDKYFRLKIEKWVLAGQVRQGANIQSTGQV